VFLFVLWRHLKLPEPTKRQYPLKTADLIVTVVDDDDAPAKFA